MATEHSEHPKYLIEFLKRAGYFATKNRLELFAALRQDRSPTVADLLKQLSHQNQATIYRNLNLFKRLGLVHVTELGWKSRVQLSSLFKRHHHHLRCKGCQVVIHLRENANLEKFLNAVATERGFTEVDHQVEITGLCPNCQQKAAQDIN